MLSAWEIIDAEEFQFTSFQGTIAFSNNSVFWQFDNLLKYESDKQENDLPFCDTSIITICQKNGYTKS